MEERKNIISLSKYRILKQLEEQEVFDKQLNNYKHEDTINDMATQEDEMFMRYVK